jgi:uncharacterized repeat protein (TIGR01451 family)
VTVGQNLSVVVTVTNHGPSPATGVSLVETLLGSVAFVSATRGAAPVSGVLTFPLGSLAVGASASVTIGVQPTVAGTVGGRAVVAANETDPVLANNTAQVTSAAVSRPKVPVPGGPRILTARRFGFHAQPTVLELTFSEDVDAVTATNLANYTLRRFRAGAPVGPAIPWLGASYDSATHTVLLRPKRRVTVWRTFQLLVRGATPLGIVDRAGHPLDGEGDGRSVGDFTALFNRASVAGPTADVLSAARSATTRLK